MNKLAPRRTSSYNPEWINNSDISKSLRNVPAPNLR